LLDNFTLVGESISRLYDDGGHLARALASAAMYVVRSNRPPGLELGMEVATSLLYLEAALDEADVDRTGHAAYAIRLAERIERVTAGQRSEPLEPWMEALYRRVSERLTLGSVVQELRATLGEVEQQIDQFFRSPQESGLLAGVPGLLGSMRGVLSVLGIDAAIQTLHCMREDVEHLLHSEHQPQDSRTLSAFQRLAANLGALGFLIDMLNVQPVVAKSLFHFDVLLGVLTPVMGRSVVTADVIHRAEAIADAMQQAGMSRDEVVAELQALQNDAQVTALPALSAHVSAARHALDHDGDRAQVLQEMQDFVATATAPRPARSTCRSSSLPGWKTMTKCARSSSTKPARLSRKGWLRSTPWPRPPATCRCSRSCAAPSTRSRAARAWSASTPSAKRPGRASSSTTTGWPNRPLPVLNCARSPGMRCAISVPGRMRSATAM
jgi:chemosensory pili system protein ChpA (sensor histidine kinase/response regulator)